MITVKHKGEQTVYYGDDWCDVKKGSIKVCLEDKDFKEMFPDSIYNTENGFDVYSYIYNEGDVGDIYNKFSKGYDKSDYYEYCEEGCFCRNYGERVILMIDLNDVDDYVRNNYPDMFVELSDASGFNTSYYIDNHGGTIEELVNGNY